MWTFRLIDISTYHSAGIPIYRHIFHNPQDLKESPFAREVILVLSFVSPRWPKTSQINNFRHLWAMSCHVRKTHYLRHISYICLMPTTTTYQHFWLPKIHRYIDISTYHSAGIPIYRHILHNSQDLKERPFLREVILVLSLVSPRWPDTSKIDNFRNLWAMSCHVRTHTIYYTLAIFHCCQRHQNINILAFPNSPIYRSIDISLCRYTDIPTYPSQSSRFKRESFPTRRRFGS
jgi:hypothetical protein